jgi:iron complex transport system substrate-binding protein
MRICSLLPSATEIVAELGLVESLVGVSEECDWPPEVRGRPVVTASRVDARRLRALVRRTHRANNGWRVKVG